MPKKRKDPPQARPKANGVIEGAGEVVEQLEGRYPATLAQQTQRPGEGVDASHVDLRHLGDFEDLKQAGTGRT